MSFLKLTSFLLCSITIGLFGMKHEITIKPGVFVWRVINCSKDHFRVSLAGITIEKVYGTNLIAEFNDDPSNALIPLRVVGPKTPIFQLDSSQVQLLGSIEGDIGNQNRIAAVRLKLENLMKPKATLRPYFFSRTVSEAGKFLCHVQREEEIQSKPGYYSSLELIELEKGKSDAVQRLRTLVDIVITNDQGDANFYAETETLPRQIIRKQSILEEPSS